MGSTKRPWIPLADLAKSARQSTAAAAAAATSIDIWGSDRDQNRRACTTISRRGGERPLEYGERPLTAGCGAIIWLVFDYWQTYQRSLSMNNKFRMMFIGFL